MGIVVHSLVVINILWKTESESDCNYNAIKIGEWYLLRERAVLRRVKMATKHIARYS